MRSEGVGSWMERRSRISGSDAALVFDGQTFSYAELAVRRRRLACLIHRLGMPKGDRIAYLGHIQVPLRLCSHAVSSAPSKPAMPNQS